MSTTEHFFAPCPRGLETTLARELETLAAESVQALKGGVEFSGPYLTCYTINLESRIASRVLWQIGHGRYRSERDIYQIAHGLPWPDWFGPQRTIRVNVAAIKSPLKSLDFATLRIKDAICDVFRAATRRRPDVDTRDPDVRIHAFLSAGDLTLYLDTSGDPLFMRGYRAAGGEAPMRENLAAGILRLSGWEPGIPLLDPMCGSGTLLTEAAMIAGNIAPGANRSFGFEKLKCHDRRAWKELRYRVRTREERTMAQTIYGSDRDGDAVRRARANLAALGMKQVVRLRKADVLEMPAPAPSGIIVTNPPYGVRMDEQKRLARFYPRLGDVLKKNYSGWRAYIFSADMRLPRLIRLSASRRTPLFNGALDCRLFEYKLVAGSNRKDAQRV